MAASVALGRMPPGEEPLEYLGAVERAATEFVELNEADRRKRNALIRAAVSGNRVEMLALLDEIGVQRPQRTADVYGLLNVPGKDRVRLLQRRVRFQRCVTHVSYDAQRELVTPLFCCAARGHLSMVNALLVKYGASPNLRSTLMLRTPLMAAAEGNHENVCRLLVDRGAEMDAWDYRGTTALMLAREQPCDVLANLQQPRDLDEYVFRPAKKVYLDRVRKIRGLFLRAAKFPANESKEGGGPAVLPPPPMKVAPEIRGGGADLTPGVDYPLIRITDEPPPRTLRETVLERVALEAEDRLLREMLLQEQILADEAAEVAAVAHKHPELWSVSELHAWLRAFAARKPEALVDAQRFNVTGRMLLRLSAATLAERFGLALPAATSLFDEVHSMARACEDAEEAIERSPV